MPSAALKHDIQTGKIKISHTIRLFVQIKRITTNIILGVSRNYATETAFLESFASCTTEPQLLRWLYPQWLHTRSQRFITQKYSYSVKYRELRVQNEHKWPHSLPLLPDPSPFPCALTDNAGTQRSSPAVEAISLESETGFKDTQPLNACGYFPQPKIKENLEMHYYMGLPTAPC